MNSSSVGERVNTFSNENFEENDGAFLLLSFITVTVLKLNNNY